MSIVNHYNKHGGIERKILKLLKRHGYGLSIEDVSKTLEINRTTAAKYLFALESRKIIDTRMVGKAKLHYPKGVL